MIGTGIVVVVDEGRERFHGDLPDEARAVLERVTVVIPTYQEAANIEAVLRALDGAVPAASILVVDDASPDGTADLVEKVASDLGRSGGDAPIRVLRRDGKEGLGPAYLAGFATALEAGARCVVEMDADGSHDADAVAALAGSIAFGADLAIGSRYVPGGKIPAWAWRRRVLSRWGNRYAAMALGLAVNDSTSGFRAYSADLLRELHPAGVRAGGYGFQIEMTYRAVRAGARVVEVPIVFTERVDGHSKMSGHIVLEALGLVTAWGLRDVIRGRRRR